ncbi:HAD family hydrolase [Novosphingobium sp.]|uniref:HAD family hydrolase n=1 Tax=Novosphingobium sp. TaxID=1874826 RepID=UPI0027337121|nr:HAD family hydrolase [Novosphingobium sp.]MDP3907860.1 HAD family hydrolase [Novosphingobium sp.]
MAKPLIISDCDEVLLHMIVPFGEWLDETQGVTFRMIGNDFANAVRYKDSGELVEPADIWKLLTGFFDTQMHRQIPIIGAVAGMNTLAEHADVVVLTNLSDKHNEARRIQLADHGINVRVFTNQGPKGPALQAILDEYQPSRAVFIDDLAQHHGSVAEISPHVDRLHLCGEPVLAPHITCGFEAGHAHARIDTWEHALPWLLTRLHGENA